MIELLQWGRGFAATDGSLAAAFGGVLPPLQWGRGFAATEGQDHLLGGVFGVLLQWGRGFAATEGRSSGVPQVDIPGFNGAVASQPRKGLKKGRKKPHNFCFNGAVASQPRKGRCRDGASGRSQASMGPWLRSHGRAFFPRPRPQAWRLASMGPWLRSHGRPTPATRGRVSVPCFNGAVASQPRKGSSDRRPSARGRGFNGAVASQPRKVELAGQHPVPVANASMGPWLRSHGRNVGGVWRLGQASVLQWGRGFAATEGQGRRWPRSSYACGFNGAVASQPRKAKEEGR